MSVDSSLTTSATESEVILRNGDNIPYPTIASFRTADAEDERDQERKPLKTDSSSPPSNYKTSYSSVSVYYERLPKPRGDNGDAASEDVSVRGQWSNPFELLLSLISMSVGLGNICRFPFVAYENGGGAFLIPYLIVVTLIGRPIYMLELAVGQFCSYGQVGAWDMAPLFRGVGYGSLLGNYYVLTFYVSIMGTAFYYLFESFKETLPWTVCDPSWAGTETCDKAQNATSSNKSIVSLRQVVNLPQLYYNNKIMQEKTEIDDSIGKPLPIQVGCLFFSWLVVCIIIARGVKSTGKAAYFTTFYPFGVLFLMLIISSIREGATDGMLYFITPQWSKMADPSVWFAAAGQCFFSLGTGFGPIVNYASFNRIHHNFYKDALTVSVADSIASLTAGLTVFATLGALAHTMNKPISHVISNSPGLIFVAFSDAISTFEYVPQLIAVLFFTMILTLAAGSAAGAQLAAVSVICDTFPSLSRFSVSIALCLLGFLLSLIYSTPGGGYMITLVNSFGGDVNIYILTTLEVIGVIWIYGLNRFVTDIEFMLGRKLGWYWKLCWAVVTPIMLTVVMIYAFINGKELKHEGRPFPRVAIICGILLTISSLLPVPICAVYAVCTAEGSLSERFIKAISPVEGYGPRLSRAREQWLSFKREKQVAKEALNKTEEPSVDALESLTLFEFGALCTPINSDNISDQVGSSENTINDS